MFESNNNVTLLCKSDYKKLRELGYFSSRSSQYSDGLSKLETAEIVDDHLFPDQIARIGTMVSLKDLGTGSIARLMLIEVTDNPPCEHGYLAVSVISPLGVTLLGMRRGEYVKWTLPYGHIRYLQISELTAESSSGC